MVFIWLLCWMTQWYHHCIVGSIFTFSIATVTYSGSSEFAIQNGAKGARLVILCIIFIINALAAGFANNLLEVSEHCISKADTHSLQVHART
jgi:hypothetical protein